MNKSEKEMVRITRTIGACFLLPGDKARSPLLTELYGDASEIGKPIKQSVPELLATIRDVAKGLGISVLVCGNLRTAPVLYLWRKPSAIPQVPFMVFASLHGDGAHCGITDFYDEHAKSVKEAVRSGMAFDTGWYSTKKEIQSGRIRRQVKNGPISVEVSVEMDEDADLVDTAMWRAAGGNAYAGSGTDALDNLGLDEEAADALIERLADETTGQSSESNFRLLHWKSGYDRICQALNELVAECDNTLESVFEGVVEMCKQEIAMIKQDACASCTNCQHFNAVIRESKISPEDPADCGHPKYYALLSSNPHFPFEHGCKFWMHKSKQT